MHIYNEKVWLSTARSECWLRRRLCMQMRTCQYGSSDRRSSQARQWLLQQGVHGLQRLAAKAEDKGVTLGLEVVNRYETNVVNTATQAMELLADVDSAALTVHLDTYHMNIEELSMAAAVRACRGKLGCVPRCTVCLRSRTCQGAAAQSLEASVDVAVCMYAQLLLSGELGADAHVAESAQVRAKCNLYSRLAKHNVPRTHT